MTSSNKRALQVFEQVQKRPVHEHSAFLDGACAEAATVRVWDVVTAKPIGPRLVHEAALRTAAFTMGGARILTGTATGTTRLWAISTTPMSGRPSSYQTLAGSRHRYGIGP
jgi:WD40 repeat protein